MWGGGDGASLAAAGAHDGVRPRTDQEASVQIDPHTTAVVLIEYQNDFATEGGDCTTPSGP